MSKFDDMIQTMKKSEYEEKKQFLEYLVRLAERAKHQFSQEDKQALLQYAYEEVAQMLRDIPEAESYKAKDRIFECEDYLLGIVMNLCASPTQIPQENLMKIKALTELVAKTVGYEGRIEWDTTRPNGTPRKLLDVSKATALGWTYQTELEEGIALAYKDFLENPIRAER